MKAFHKTKTEDETLMLITHSETFSSDTHDTSGVSFFPPASTNNMLREVYTTPKILSSSHEVSDDNLISEHYRVHFQNFQKKNIEVLSEKLFKQLEDELSRKSEIVDGLEEIYKQIVYSEILPSIFELSPMGASLSITADNTLTMTVNFLEEIYLDLESFIFNHDENKPVNVAYTLYTLDEDLKTRYCSLDKFRANLRTDLSRNLANNEIEIISSF